MVENAPSFLLASVESYLGSKVANRENADALVRQLSLLFSITSDNAGPDDLQRFDDVFVSLADRVDADARGFLALQLSVSVNAPHRILRRLAGDVITVARPILIHSPLLTDADLVEIAKRHGIAHMQAIAERNELTIEVTDILILDGDDAVRRSVAANHGAEISTSGLRRLSEQAVGDEELEVAMTQRPDVPEIIIRFLIRHGSGAAQRILNDRSTAIATPVDERLHVPSRSIDAWYAVYDFDAAEARVAVLTEQGMRGEQLLMRFVAEERFPEAVLVLARLIGVRIGTMVAWMTTEKPDHFLAAARAIELSARAVFAILNIGPWRLLLDGRRRQDAVRSYQALDVEDARRRVHDWRYAPVRLTPAPM